MSQLTLLQGGSHVSRSALQDEKKERKITVTSGRKCLELLKSLSPLGSLAKTLLTSSVWHSNARKLTWKVKATKCNHLLYQLAVSMPPTNETECGLWPTPTARDFRDFGNPTPTQYRAVKKRDSPSGALIMTTRWGFRISPRIYEWMMGYPIGWTELED